MLTFKMQRSHEFSLDAIARSACQPGPPLVLVAFQGQSDT